MPSRLAKLKQPLNQESDDSQLKQKHTRDQLHHKTSGDVKADIRIAIDFGTTYTAIAFSKANGISNILTIEEFPGDNRVGDNGTQVSTEIWYSKTTTTVTNDSDTQEKSPQILYGYEVQRRLELPANDSLCAKFKARELVTRPKLLLDDNAHLKDLKANLGTTLNLLRKVLIIKNKKDVIEDLLICSLRHTKYILHRDHGLESSSTGMLHRDAFEYISTNTVYEPSRGDFGGASMLDRQVKCYHD